MHDLYDTYLKNLEELPGAGFRKGQLTLIQRAADAEPGERLLVKAPTATGKSFAALMAAGERAKAGERTVIATYTKILQNQYRDKDVTRIQALYPDVDFAVLKGADNYVCRENARAALRRGIQVAQYRKAVQAIADGTGDPGEWPDSRIKRWVAADRDDCSKDNPEECGYAAAKARAREAKVVITNHTLVMINSQLPAVLGDHSLLILDEIHNLPKAAEAFGTKVISVESVSRAVIKTFSDPDVRATVLTQVEPLFMVLEQGSEDRFPTRKEVHDLIPLFKALVPMHLPVDKLTEDDRKLISIFGPMRDWISVAVKRIREGGTQGAYQMAMVGAERRTLKLAVVDIASVAKRALATRLEYQRWNGKALEPVVVSRAVVAMSATTGAGEHPKFVAERCGVPDVELVELAPELPYATNMRVSVMGKETTPWPVRVEEMIHDTGGRTLVLLSAWARIDQMQEYLERVLPYRVYCQVRNDAPATAVEIEKFKADVDSVLIGTVSLYEGINVEGPSLSQVIVGNFPMVFIGSGPVGAERRRRLGRRWTADMQIPYTATVLEQMAGRLIRTVSDRGLVAVLDDQARSAWGQVAVEQGMETFGRVLVGRSKALAWYRAG